MVVAELKRFQSLAERQPRVEELAVLQLMVGWLPMTKALVPLVTVMPVPLAMDEVETVPRVEGVPAPVQYARLPMEGVVEVETALA